MLFRSPEAIANKVYGGRMGNGQEETGDGWKYHGRGLIQLTGKENYANCGSGIGVDLLSNPNLLNTPEYAALSAGWFWKTHNCNDLAEAKNWTALTKKINGGTFGLDERVKLTQTALNVL